MLKFSACLMGIAGLAACAGHQPPAGHQSPPMKASAPQPALRSGIDLAFVDGSVRAQDDVYQYLNGQWLRTFQLPPDKGAVGSFTAIEDETEEQLRSIVEGLDQAASGDADPDAKKLADLYASFMNEEQIEALGLKPLQAEFASIDAIKDMNGIPALIAHMNAIGAGAPYGLGINLDARNSTQYAVTLFQSGLGLPDRDYYLKDDAKLKDARTAYRAHIEKMLTMAGEAKTAAGAEAILNLETSLAKVQWTRVEERDPIKTYNKTAISELSALMPGYDWTRYARSAGFEGKVDAVIVTEPSYFKALAKVMTGTPLPVWKTYFKWRVLSASAPHLSPAFVGERFAFTGGGCGGV